MNHIPVIDLHGIIDPFLALEQLEKELFLLFQHKHHSLRVVHGIGTGRLADLVHEALQNNPLVVKFEEENTGGSCLVFL